MEKEVFEAELNKRTGEAESIIRSYLPKTEGHQATVIEAMNYSVLVGGKRLRPVIMKETFRMLGGKGKFIDPFIAAIEMIHTYSLVHDDLPAMDNDRLRRGKPTTWSMYGEAMGILAGDGLLNYAFETAAKSFEMCSTSDSGREVSAGTEYSRLKVCTDALTVLARKAGIYGMVGGQTLDVEAEKAGRQITEEELIFIHENKTSAMIESAFLIGGILAGEGGASLERLEQIGRKLGLAFQIRDDYLDVKGDEKILGKPIGSDEESGKQTYVTLHGLEKAEEEVERLSKETLELLAKMPGNHEFMEELIKSLITREK